MRVDSVIEIHHFKVFDWGALMSSPSFHSCFFHFFLVVMLGHEVQEHDPTMSVDLSIPTPPWPSFKRSRPLLT